MVSEDPRGSLPSEEEGRRLPRPLRIVGATLAVLTTLFLLALVLSFTGLTVFDALTGDSEPVTTTVQAAPTTTAQPTTTVIEDATSTTLEQTTTEGAAAVECGTYQDVVCQGFFTDEPGIASDHEAIERRVGRVGVDHDVEFALVVVENSRGAEPSDFAVGLGEAWGVGDPTKRNGLVVLVTLDERRVEVAQHQNVDVSGEFVAGAAGPSFEVEDWDAGLIAIVEAVDRWLAHGPGTEPVIRGDGSAAINVSQRGVQTIRFQFTVRADFPLSADGDAIGLIRLDSLDQGWRINGLIHCITDLSPFESTGAGGAGVWEVRFIATQSDTSDLPAGRYASIYVRDDPTADAIYMLDPPISWNDRTCSPRGELLMVPLLDGDIEFVMAGA